MWNVWDSQSINIVLEKVDILNQFSQDKDVLKSNNTYNDMTCKAVTNSVKIKKVVFDNHKSFKNWLSKLMTQSH